MFELENRHFIGGLAPNADFAAGTVYTDVFNIVGDAGYALVWYGTNASSGASTLTVEACDDTTPTNSTAVAFYYRVATTFDTFGDWTEATTAGITVGGSADSAWEIYVPSSELAQEGYGYMRIKMVESVNQAADGVVACYVVNPTYPPTSNSLID